jgi:hypothetical protein
MRRGDEVVWLGQHRQQRMAEARPMKYLSDIVDQCLDMGWTRKEHLNLGLAAMDIHVRYNRHKTDCGFFMIK